MFYSATYNYYTVAICTILILLCSRILQIIIILQHSALYEYYYVAVCTILMLLCSSHIRKKLQMLCIFFCTLVLLFFFTILYVFGFLVLILFVNFAGSNCCLCYYFTFLQLWQQYAPYYHISVAVCTITRYSLREHPPVNGYKKGPISAKG